METRHHHQQQMNREKGIEERQENKQDQPIITSSPPPQQNSQASNSSSSSPSHEFTFTISLHNSTYNPSITKFTNNDEENSKAPPNNSHFNPLAVDLSPADEIFFHGHLLPLHLLSHLPQSPSRSSTNSMDSFTLPIRELLEDDENHKESGSCSTSNRSNITIDNNNNNNNNKNRGNRGNREDSNNNTERKREGKSNNFTFSLFGLKKGLKGSKVRDGEEKENHQKKKKKKLRFDVIHALKKYMKMVQPMVFFKGKREKFRINGKCSYSYSGSVTPRNNDSNNNKKNKKEFIRGWRGEYYSAPASMRTSPTNSGVLVATNNALMIPPASDSTMEELQAAIQAAIAHCKNSIAKEEKLKS